MRLRHLRQAAKWSGLGALLLINLTVVVLSLLAGRGCTNRMTGKPKPVIVSKTLSPDGRWSCAIRSLERPGNGTIEFLFALENQQGPLAGTPMRLVEDNSNGTEWLATWRNHTVSIFTGNGGLGVFRFAGTVTNRMTESGLNEDGQIWSTNSPRPSP